MIERPHSNETLRDTSPFYRLWPEALAGEENIERFLHGDATFEYSPIALMQALLVQTWRLELLIDQYSAPAALSPIPRLI